MSREKLRVRQELDPQSAEWQLALQCAPLITGIKLSNLLIVKNGQVESVHKIFEGTGISCYTLYESEYKTVQLLYRFRPLYRYLTEPRVRGLFRQLGYHEFTLERLLMEFALRYTAYMRDRVDFPHEMGLLLGYPVEDVCGFMEHDGKNYLCSGYWKVYKDAETKLRLFHKFDQAKEMLLRFAANGISLREVILRG